jgi:neutral ceramidase
MFRTHWPVGLFVFWVWACTAWGLTINESDSNPQAFQVGTARVDITPPAGTPLAGYYSPRGADEVHDPLYASAMVLSDGQSRVALISLDIIKTDSPTVNEARELIAQQTGIPGEAVMISATHSHTGPVISAPVARESHFGGADPLAVRYRTALPGKIAQAVAEAQAALTTASVSSVVGHCEGIAFNRRFHMTDGTVGWNPGKLNPRIIRPAGPIDPDIPTLLFQDPQGNPLAAYISYSLHLDTVGGTAISSDMPHTLRTLLAATKGNGFFTLYVTGCCGDVNHLDVSHALPQKGHGEAARIGTRLAGDVLKALDRARPLPNLTLRHRQRFVELPCFPITDDDRQLAQDVLQRIEAKTTPAPGFREMVPAYRAADIMNRNEEPYRVEVQVFTIGDTAAIVSLPGEIFVELGITIRHGSPFTCTAIAELANGSIGYVPNRVAYPQGNYEVDSARVAQGAGETLVDTALDMLRELYAEHVTSRSTTP